MESEVTSEVLSSHSREKRNSVGNIVHSPDSVKTGGLSKEALTPNHTHSRSLSDFHALGTTPENKVLPQKRI
eukprot:TRINITY_DN17270_c0_g1_i1.p2 TRINITY_DN17270_c0_g1~~TRINITY_DN17270_c0_g1_i1.p2  ORF type:complete len:72 (-),score=10.90 TRINITY_DN17270_c0_g1_i1:237-452(-)